jgi:two-component system phosphate regulon sensor histidine kinase PhoR
MRGLSFRTKLLATYLGLLGVVVGTTMFALERSLGEELVHSLNRRLEAQAREVAVWVRRAGHPERLAPRLAAVVGARVSIIAGDGAVVADSDGQGGAAARLDPATTQEIALARRFGAGQATRAEAPGAPELHHVAVPVGGDRFVRLSVPMSDIHGTRRTLRARLLLIASAGLVMALVLGLLAVRAVARPLQTMTASARRLARGDYDVPPPFSSPDELGVLSRSLATLAADLQARIGDLTRERDLLSSVLAALVEGVLVVAEDGRVLLANPRALAIVPTQIGASLAPERLRQVLESAVNGGSSAEDELRLGEHDVVVTAQPLRAPGAGGVLVLYDVTRLRRLETMRRDFLANVSHELRTPVTAIRGYAETLLHTEMEPGLRSEFLEIVHRNAERIGRLVADLLVVQDAEANPTAVENQPVSVAPLVAHVLGTAQARAAARQIALVAEVAEGLQVLADPGRLEQVLLNLVENALNYGRSGGQVRVTAEAESAWVRLCVADDGPGIAPEHHDRIFERFFRVDAGRSRQHGGTGLGLAIVKHLTEAMGGRVTVDSELGRGARFSVLLRRSA